MLFTLQRILLLVFCASVVLTCALIAKTVLVLNGCEGCVMQRILDYFGMDYGQNWAGISMEQMVSLSAKLKALRYAIGFSAIMYVLYCGAWYARQFETAGGGVLKVFSLFGRTTVMFCIVFMHMTLVLDITKLMDSMS